MIINVRISRKPTPNGEKNCIKRKEGKRTRYYCIDKPELKDYLYDIIYMKKNHISLAVRLFPEKMKYYEYYISTDKIQIREKAIADDQDPESYIATEYLGESVVIIKDPISKIKRMYKTPWYQYKYTKYVIFASVSLIFILLSLVILKPYIKRLQQRLHTNINKLKPPPPMGKTIPYIQKQTMAISFTKDALYQIASAIDQLSSVGYPAYISSIQYVIQDTPPAPGKNEQMTANLDMAFRFAYPVKGATLITTKPVPVYSKTVSISLSPNFSVNVLYMDTNKCGLQFLKDGLYLYNVDTLEFKGTITDYKKFYDFIKTMFYCKGYINSLKLTNPSDVLLKTKSVKQITNKKINQISAEIDLHLMK